MFYLMSFTTLSLPHCLNSRIPFAIMTTLPKMLMKIRMFIDDHECIPVSHL